MDNEKNVLFLYKKMKSTAVIKVLRKALRYAIIAITVLVTAFIALLIYLQQTDYQPAPSEKIIVKNTAKKTKIEKQDLTLLIWNIGYCGLDKKMDFFYDGGTQVRPDAISFQKNLNGVFQFLSENDSVDFIMLQEVDTAARRSYYANQLSVFSQALLNYSFSFATNYNVKYVPVPLFKPMGYVVSGITTFSRFAPTSCVRYAYPVNYSWPMKLLMLDRCFMLQRYQLSNGKELVLINLHNSAFENADMLRQYELWMLRGFLLTEYANGNYVIVGGDWNQNPPSYEKLIFNSGYVKKQGTPMIPKDFVPNNWQYAFDKKTPTNRDVNTAYQRGITPTTIYDFFITSPNIVVDRVKAINCNFEFSDHQPVYIHVRLDQSALSGCSEDCLQEISLLKDSIKMQKDKAPKKWVKKKK